MSGDPDQATAKELDVLKIEIYSEQIHTRYSTTLSTSFAVFVGFIVILYTLLHDDFLALGLAVGVLTAGTLFEIYRIRVGYTRNLTKISEFIEMIGEGTALPRLEDL